MEVFRRANVVDAGGLGFLMILESYLEALEPAFAKAQVCKERPSEKIRKFVQILSNRYEVVSLIENPRFEEKIIKEKLRKLGNSLDMVQIGNKMKLHIHTDYPDEVRDILREAGQIRSLRVEDMAKEVGGEESVRKVSVGIVTDNVAMLLPKIAERYQIEEVSARWDWPEEKDLPGENIYQKMRVAEKYGVKTTPKTSQATPKQYLDAFEKQLQKFDKILCITVSSKVSGCYNSAIQAKEMIKNPEKIFILDSLNAAAGQALLILEAIDLIQEQREIGEVIQELKNLIFKIHFYLIFEDPKWIESIGRITHSQANWIRRMKRLRLHPVMELKNGAVGKGGIVIAQDSAEALFKKIFKETKKVRNENKKIRVIIGHADNLEQAEKLKKMLKEKISNIEIPYVAMAPTIICAGAGPGTLLAGWQAI